jgi:XTP/dITP diphosphohydrolase
MGEKLKLTIASRNEGKIKEFKNAFQDLNIEVIGLNDLPEIDEIIEDGKTFEENAIKKAMTVFHQVGGYVLADDSGIESEDLNGRPGVYSARFAGPNATDEENNKKLVQMIQDIHDPTRRLSYVCVLVLVDPDGSETLVKETCDGVITFVPSGKNGFGYDPYFFLPEKNCTMADLSLDEKREISHRGLALRKIHEVLKEELK